MPDLNFIRAEIEHMRRQIVRHRKEIQDLQRAGIATKSADELLVRMQARRLRSRIGSVRPWYRGQ